MRCNGGECEAGRLICQTSLLLPRPVHCTDAVSHGALVTVSPLLALLGFFVCLLSGEGAAAPARLPAREHRAAASSSSGSSTRGYASEQTLAHR